MTSYKNIITAIEELHSPVYHTKAEGDQWIICNVCKTRYPCRTIQVIEDLIDE